MNNYIAPLIIEADELESHLQDDNILIIDLCKDETYLQSHIPGAVHLKYPDILHVQKPVMGLLPDMDSLSNILSKTGITPETHVIAYDDEGGGKACRLLWTLDVIGHKHFSLLNGGLHAWANEGHPLSNALVTPVTTEYGKCEIIQGRADKDYVLNSLDNNECILLDSRSIEEYTGVKRFAERGGHIPGAINLDWMITMNKDANLRLLPDDELNKLLQSLGITADKEIILYCQTHHRSSHAYIMLKHLGYTKLRGYPGAWSEWGNLPGMPVEV
ncbi:MAG: sulfurtransferase [Gammaproteobacteria bacterium]|nr:sulfurtransferase [Gammaproteobacteria bacterium]